MLVRELGGLVLSLMSSRPAVLIDKSVYDFVHHFVHHADSVCLFSWTVGSQVGAVQPMQRH